MRELGNLFYFNPEHSAVTMSEKKRVKLTNKNFQWEEKPAATCKTRFGDEPGQSNEKVTQTIALNYTNLQIHNF